MLRRARAAASSLLVLLAVFAAPLGAAPPSADWRTASTPRFRIHYPIESEAWALAAAGRLEAIRTAVAREVGFDSGATIDVFVLDPLAQPNGSAWPFLSGPRLVFWTSPPGASSALGNVRDWGELLGLHEQAHLAHLLRPSRNPALETLGKLIPFGPLAWSAPRWATEGYATLIEGRLSGSGRPHGDFRAAVLRRFAMAGKLPSYERLSAADSRSYLGSSMAYLAGSAFLEWLEERAGEGSLVKLWARLSARERRSFDAAFDGVFGDSPRDLWDRFRSELSARALAAEERLGPFVEGELWQDLDGATGAPALSPTGDRLAIVLDRRDEPDELVVWSTAPDSEAEAAAARRSARSARLDPDDVPAVRARPLPREPLHRLAAMGGRSPIAPRFLPGGEAILFVRFEPDGDGFLHPDLFVWTLASGEVRRITRGGDVRDPAPTPDGTAAIAVRHRHGRSQLVRVDLATGAIAELTAPALGVVVDHPRLAPDGKRLVYLRHDADAEGAWRLIVRDLATGSERELPLPAGAAPAAPTFSADGATIYATLGREGRIDVAALAADGTAVEPRFVTRTRGAAFEPVATPDGRALFYLTLEPDGLDLVRLDLTGARPDAAVIADDPPLAELVPIVPPPGRPVPALAIEPVEPGRPYGLGRLETLPLLGGSAGSASGSALELGARIGDPLGRIELLALGGRSATGVEGGALALALRRHPTVLGLRVYDVRTRPSLEHNAPHLDDRSLDLARRGIEISAERRRRFGALDLRLAGRALAERLGRDRRLAGNQGNLDHLAAGGEIDLAANLTRGGFRVAPAAIVRAEAATTDGEGLRRGGVEVALDLGRRAIDLRLTARRDEVRDARYRFDLVAVGGVESSLAPQAFERVAAPALPTAALLGARHEGMRADLTVAQLPTAFFERHRTADEGGRFGGWLAFAGLEETLHLGRLPIARLPALDLRLGAARIVEAPSRTPSAGEEGDLRGWISVVWRP